MTYTVDIMRNFILNVITILFPPHCYICHKEGQSLCAKCLSHCKKSIDTQALYVTSVYSFQDPIIKKIIHAIKYFHRKDLVKPLAQSCVEELRKFHQELVVKDAIFIPIPMPLLRKYIRGYNQAEVIAQELSKHYKIPYTTKLLYRKGNHKRQVTTKTRGERIKNQYHSFIVKGEVNNLDIILVDDVTTTGATIIEARNELLRAGAKSVRAMTVAH